MGLFKTDPNCLKQQEHVNIPDWHEKGYTGKGLTIFHDDISDISHSECCVDIIQTILPDARLLSGRISYTSVAGTVNSCSIYCNETKETLPFDDFVTKHDVSQFNNSTSGGASNNLDTPIAKYMRDKIKQYNLVCTGAAGNNDSQSNNFKGAFLMVSGVFFYAKTGEIMDYGPAWDWVDFSMFMGFQMGTSFASPFLNGMAGLLRSKYGRGITQEEIYEYFKNHCEHLGKPGRNPEYGWGVPILGNPETTIKLKVGSNIMTVDGREVQIDQPVIVDSTTDRALVPVRAISEAFGAEVGWNQKEQEITIRR